MTTDRREALLREFDGSVCPACHHVTHDPGSCRDCPRCELHTDEAAAFVLRYEPDLLAADPPAPPSDPVPLYLDATLPRRTFNLRNGADFAWLADYFSGYHGVPGLRAAADPPALDVERPAPRDFGEQIVVRQGLPKELAARIDAIDAASPTLDVERVAEILERWEVDCDPDGHITHSTCDHDEQAASFVREYERLSREEERLP